MPLNKFSNLKTGTKLGIFLGAVGLLGFLNFSAVVYYSSKKKMDAIIVNAAGRNRMLSQRIAFYVERVQKGQSVSKELLADIDLLSTTLNALKLGGLVPGISNGTILPPTPDYILPTLLRAEETWNVYRDMAIRVSRLPLKIDTVILVYSDSLNAKYDTRKIENPDIASAVSFVENNAQSVLIKLNDLVKLYVSESERKQAGLKDSLIILLLVNLAVIFTGFRVVRKYIVSPVEMIDTAAKNLSNGIINLTLNYKSKDEIGSASESINKMIHNIEGAVHFADEIGKGSLEAHYEPASDHDRLGHALVDMRNRLKELRIEDDKRKWVNEGLARFADIQQNFQDNLKELCESLIINLVKYVKANQGAIFVLNEDNDNDVHMELMALYAWNKKKFTEKRIELGEGFVGQSWAEKDVIYLKEIPDQFVEITSGLGKANPNTILVMPLIMNEKVHGMVELATFKEYEKHEIDFVSQL